MERIILSRVGIFQEKYKVPILPGEFDLQYEQRDGVEYLSDYVDIAKSYNRHFVSGIIDLITLRIKKR